MTENPKVDNPETPEETYETIPDHLVSQKSGQFPIMYSTTAEMPGTGAYEDIGQSSSVGNKKSAHYQNAQNNNNDVHGYVNTPTPPKADVEHEANTEEYENVREKQTVWSSEENWVWKHKELGGNWSLYGSGEQQEDTLKFRKFKSWLSNCLGRKHLKNFLLC